MTNERDTNPDAADIRDRILKDVIAMLKAERERLIMLRFEKCGHEVTHTSHIYTVRANAFDEAARMVEEMMR